MSQFESEAIYYNALMSDVAYVHLLEGYNYIKYTGSQYTGKLIDDPLENQSARLALKDRGWTDEQFDDFRNRYLIVDHMENTATGLSITIFQDAETGKRTVAFRGTETAPLLEAGIADLVRDLVLALGFSEATVGLGQSPAIKEFLEKNDLLLSDGSVNPEYAHDVNIVGHSLGGHLTLMTALDYPDLVNQAMTFNGAGLALLDSFYNQVLSPILSSHSQADLDNLSFRTTNVYAEPGFEATHSQLWFNYIGSQIPVFIEKQGGEFSIGNHLLSFLVDALSVQRVLSLMGPDLEINQLDELLWQSSSREIENVTSETGLPDTSNRAESAISLNLTMSHLATQLGGAFSNLNGTNDAAKLYAELTSAMAAGQTFTLKPISTYSDPVATASLDPSSAGIALRYALLTGCPFAVIPPEGYAEGIFNANDESNSLYGLDQFSEQFWADRFDFYSRLIDRNVSDINEPGPSEYGTISGILLGNGNNQFYDYYTQQQFEYGQNSIHIRGAGASEYTDAENDPMIMFGSDENDQGEELSGRNGKDHIYGMGGADLISGDGGDDYLEGGAGNDTLTGGKGNDRLYGRADEAKVRRFTVV